MNESELARYHKVGLIVLQGLQSFNVDITCHFDNSGWAYYAKLLVKTVDYTRFQTGRHMRLFISALKPVI